MVDIRERNFLPWEQTKFVFLALPMKRNLSFSVPQQRPPERKGRARAQENLVKKQALDGMV